MFVVILPFLTLPGCLAKAGTWTEPTTGQPPARRKLSLARNEVTWHERPETELQNMGFSNNSLPPFLPPPTLQDPPSSHNHRILNQSTISASPPKLNHSLTLHDITHINWNSTSNNITETSKLQKVAASRSAGFKLTESYLCHIEAQEEADRYCLQELMK